MKKIVVVLMSMLAMLVAACGGSNAEAISTDNGGKIMQSENKTNSSKALVVYYSRSGNTEALARMIGNETGADMFRVTTVTPYPEVYRETTELARAERDNNARPAINGRVENMADYDVVYIGVPNWWSTMPMPMFTFLEQYDLSGKTIVPFVTHGGGGVANCVSAGCIGSQRRQRAKCPERCQRLAETLGFSKIKYHFLTVKNRECFLSPLCFVISIFKYILFSDILKIFQRLWKRFDIFSRQYQAQLQVLVLMGESKAGCRHMI